MWIFGRKGASGFSASSTAEEVACVIDGSPLTAIVTGASSGLGMETARVLALCGVHVIIADCNVDGGKRARESIIEEAPNAEIDVMELDLSSIASVRKFASDYNSSNLPLNILINNAGIFGPPFTLSQDNIELQFATNHLGHFLLTNLLLDNMKKTALKSEIEGRIVNVASEGHRVALSSICFDKINDPSSYNKLYAYGQSKLANILHANELARRLKEEGVNITANSLHPGAIPTNIVRLNAFASGLLSWIGKIFLKTIPQGAATSCYVGLHPQVKGITGEYFADNNISKGSSLATNVELAKQLWEFSVNLTEPK